MEMWAFIDDLSSKKPTPGGGGVSALLGALAAALCSMVANLTLGKEKYREFENDIERILESTSDITESLYALIARDAAVFEPLSKAYSIPKTNKERDKILESALIDATSVPSEILDVLNTLVYILEELEVKGSKMVASDVAVAALACKCAMESALVNVYVNTKLMKDHIRAKEINQNAEKRISDSQNRCLGVYNNIMKNLRI